jgi:hypothetical protein
MPNPLKPKRTKKPATPQQPKGGGRDHSSVLYRQRGNWLKSKLRRVGKHVTRHPNDTVAASRLEFWTHQPYTAGRAQH